MEKALSLVGRRNGAMGKGGGLRRKVGETQGARKGGRMSLKDAYCAQQPGTKETVAFENPHGQIQTVAV